MSLSHLVLLAIIAIIVIPPEKLPEVARQAARFLRDMRNMTSGIFDEFRKDVLIKPEDLLKTPTPPIKSDATANSTDEKNTKS